MEVPLANLVDVNVDLNAYFDRVEYRGPRSPTLETLRAVVFAHVTHIPFEAFDVATGHGVHLKSESADKKILHSKRGGYCFEQNILMARVLAALGYTVSPISSRVRLNGNPSWKQPRTHVSVLVTLEGVRYIVDVGIGSLSLSCPILLDSREEQLTPHEPRRVVQESNNYIIEAKQGGVWSPVNEFTLEAMFPVDREISNWYTSTHPDSVFCHHLMASLTLPEGRVNLLDAHVSFRDRHGEKTKEFTITSREQLLEVLREQFGIVLPQDFTFRPTIMNFPSVSS